jgi:BMFP domain-containing protein YqiC
VFKAFENADKVLAVLENLEQVTRERQAAADEASAKTRAAEAELTAAIGALEDAKSSAKRIEAATREKAKTLVSDASEAAHAAEGEARARVAALEAQAKELEGAVMSKQFEITSAASELASLQGKIAEAKKAARALLEG